MYWTGETDESARNYNFYYYEDQLTAVRVGPWKMHFATKPTGRYYDDLVQHTMPKLFNLRKDPFEHYDGDKKRVAETLGISLKTLYNRLNAYKRRNPA